MASKLTLQTFANVCMCFMPYCVSMMWLKGAHLHSKCSKIRKKNKDSVRICTTWKLKERQWFGQDIHHMGENIANVVGTTNTKTKNKN